MSERVGTRHFETIKSGLTEAACHVKESTTTQRIGRRGTGTAYGSVEVRIGAARVEACRLPRLSLRVSDAPRSATADCAGVGRCGVDGQGTVGRRESNDARLALAQAVVEAYAVRDDITVAEIAREFGISRKTAYNYIAAAGVAHRQAKNAPDTDTAIGRDLPYTVQLTAGFPCAFSVQFEGAGCEVCLEKPEAEL